MKKNYSIGEKIDFGGKNSSINQFAMPNFKSNNF